MGSRRQHRSSDRVTGSSTLARRSAPRKRSAVSPELRYPEVRLRMDEIWMTLGRSDRLTHPGGSRDRVGQAGERDD